MAEAPTHRVLLVGGDWNWYDENDDVFDAEDFHDNPYTQHSDRQLQVRNLSHDQKCWSEMMKPLTYVKQPKFTHFLKKENRLSFFDRYFVKLPKWMCRLIVVSVHTRFDPTHLHAQGISDHVPIKLCIERKDLTPESCQPITHSVCRHKMFKKYHDWIWAQANMDIPCVADRLAKHKSIIREAARLTRNFLNSTANDDDASDAIYTTISRCYFYQDIRLPCSL